MKTIIVLTLSILAAPHTVQAIVDMRLANYSDSWTDLELPGTGYDLKVTRTYNSRSLFNGMFGFGWCSDFETQFSKTAEGLIKLKECGDGRVTFFRTRSFSKKTSIHLVNQIVARVKKDGTKYSKAYLKRLKANLINNPNERQAMAEKYKISTGTSKETVYYSDRQNVETLVLKNGYYERRFADGTKQRFNTDGFLTHMYDKNGNYLKLTYSNKKLSTVRDNNGRQLAFSHHSNGKVKSIRGPSGMSVNYKYKKVSDLVYVKSAWGNEYTYEYDELHNLTKISYPDKTFKLLTYDSNKDWVTSFKGRSGCKETYKYTFDSKNKKNHYWADVLKICKDKVKTRAKFEFWYKSRAKLAGKFLYRTKTIINGNSNDVIYSEEFGRPIKTVTNGKQTVFGYYSNGLLKTRKSGKELATFKYNKKFNKVSEVRIGKRKTYFNYDTKGNLVAAKSTAGQSVKLEYDKKGRIVSLVDQAQRVVKITYDVRFGKPKIIERPGIGKILVSYKKNGDIKKVDSKQGPTVATQVASTFNSLLDIVSPAGIDLGL